VGLGLGLRGVGLARAVGGLWGGVGGWGGFVGGGGGGGRLGWFGGWGGGGGWQKFIPPPTSYVSIPFCQERVVKQPTPPHPAQSYPCRFSTS